MRTYERAGLWIAVSLAIVVALDLRIPERAATAQPTNQIIRVATVDMFQLLESMIDSDRYKPARDARDAEIKSKYDAILAELKSLETKIQLIPQGTPEFQTTMSQGQAKEMERQQFAQQVGRDQDAFVASQVKEAYALVHAAVNESAAALGYTHVFTTRTSATNMKGDSLAPVMQEILARPLVRTSTTDDITDKVRVRLGLPEKAASTDDAGAANGGR
ncbi:MAG: OmpH family outer membrane protein [Phycisphaeraceae bacterium]|nr:OmpH family outer membrane protein [Phycisphaeraceae bacterium]MCW5767746.1 OmpH family outer membrane protein [Phycisphaeraceae bacterium]